MTWALTSHVTEVGSVLFESSGGDEETLSLLPARAERAFITVALRHYAGSSGSSPHCAT